LDAPAHRGAEIIRALRSFLSIDTGDKQPFDLAELVGQTFRLVNPESTQHSITMTADTVDAPMVVGNRIQVAQVLVNLLRNAIQAIATSDPKLRNITVTTSTNGPLVEVCVQDTGGGIDPKIDLFAQFATSKPDGMGLGLSLARDLIQAGGGEMWFKEGRNGKTNFYFSIPRHPQEET
jgi:signal transduction histidine kinase